MISTPGPMELLLILGLALLVLGPNRLPSAARSAGKAVRDFRDALSGGDRDEEDEFAADDEELVAAGPAAEAEYRERAAGEDENASPAGGADRKAAGPAGEAEFRERKSGSGTEAGDPAPPPIS